MQKIMKNEPFLVPVSELPDFGKLMKPVPTVMRKEFKIQQDVSYNWYSDIYGVIYWAILNRKVITINMRDTDSKTGRTISENTEPEYERVCSPTGIGLKIASPNAVKREETIKASVNIQVCQMGGYSSSKPITEPVWKVYSLQNISKIKIESHGDRQFTLPKPSDKPKKITPSGEVVGSWWCSTLILSNVANSNGEIYYDKGYKKLNFTVI